MSERKDFSNRVVVITGGSRGIGYAAAQAFLTHGAKVAFCATDAARLQQAAGALRELGTVEAMVADVRDYAQSTRFVDHVLQRFKKIDVLVNNAGRVWSGDFATQSQSTIDDVLEANLKGTLYLTRLVLPDMLARRDGVIVNVASGAGLSGIPGIAAYCATKYGVIGFTEALAQEVADQGVRVHVVCPGRVATDMQVQYSGNRIGMPPERVADAILKLAGAQPPVRSGEYLVVG